MESLRNLFRTEGPLDRGQYLLAGLVGFAIKHNLDRFVALAFGRKWDLFNYWIPLDKAVRFTTLPRQDLMFLATMVVLSLPFIWAGVVLTMRRLRSMGWPSWPVVFFFVPLGNLLFFLLLSVVPSKLDAEPIEPRPGVLRRLIPESATGSAVVAVLLTLLLGLASTLLSTQVLALYGWGLFVALPFCMGLTAVLLYGYHEPRTAGRCLLVSMLPMLLLGLALMALLIEGVFCLAMAAPIMLPLSLLGGWVGYLIQRRAWAGAQAPAMMLFLVLTIPFLMGAEYAIAPTPPVFEATTTLDIAAPPEVVWKNVVEFSVLPLPTEWIFQSGISYPMRAEIRGRGVGAIRYCVFSTGRFVEPIEVWSEPRLLKFSVEVTPEPMRELSFGEVRPQHLEGFFISRGGQFRLVPLAGGSTRLEGTTWYTHGLWPAEYWRLWSDAVIHRIHMRVLRHIKNLSEVEAAPEGK